MLKFASYHIHALSRNSLRLCAFFSLPKHDVLSMPALSPTMKEGKIIKWLIKEGDKVEPGDAIAEVETDKATMAFEVQEKGFIAKINTSSGFIPIGQPVAVLAKKLDEVKQFSSFDFASEHISSSISQGQKKTQSTPTSPSSTPHEQKSTKDYPKHSFLQMPAVSPTMTEGKILKWKINPGEAFSVGDALFSIETDKAVVDYEATEKGVLAKIIANNNESLSIGTNVAVVVKRKDQVPLFSDFSQNTRPSIQQSSSKVQGGNSQVNLAGSSAVHPNSRMASSPLAKAFARRHNVDLAAIRGSGPAGRIIKQDIDNFLASKSATTVQPSPTKTEAPEVKPEQKTSKPKPVLVDNPFEDIQLTGMRKTIASRLTESKQNIPHYYITQSIEMDSITALRTELNKNEKQNGVKISINDIILKAMALALRDYPDVNVQWHGSIIRKFKYSDISVAVAVEGGLITPIVRRAQTLGFIELAKRTKDIAKRAREGKLDPSQYMGGTSTISNLGMYGINTVTSIINPPQATILGVGKTEAKLLPSQGPNPYRVAQVMDVIASCDHRAVDGALAAQWLNRIKFYLQNPTNMLL